MKKLVYLFSITFLFFQGCSSENSNSSTESNDNKLFMERYDGYAWKSKTKDNYLWINNILNPPNYYNATIGLYYYKPATSGLCYNEERVWSTRTNDFMIESSNSQQSLVLKYNKYTTLSTSSWAVGDLAKLRTFTVQNNVLKEEIEYFENNVSTKKEVFLFDSLGKTFINSKIADFSVCRF